MNLIKLFLLSILLATGGTAIGGAAGMNIGPGGLLLGGFVVGSIFVVISGFLSVRWRWIAPSQRLWAILGGAFGFALACMVALATITVPGALLISTVLVGLGTVLGAVVGLGPHSKS